MSVDPIRYGGKQKKRSLQEQKEIYESLQPAVRKLAKPPLMTGQFFFTADEHYGHENAIRYNNRPFENADEMDNELIRRHNEIVSPGDLVIHVGDFTLRHNRRFVENAYIKRLNGNHIFLKGSHDYWLEYDPVEIDADSTLQIWEQEIKTDTGVFYIVACHYAMRQWPRSQYGAWQIHGHNHGSLKPGGKQLDVGVDTNNYYPYSLEQIRQQMQKQQIKPGTRKHEKNVKRKRMYD